MVLIDPCKFPWIPIDAPEVNPWVLPGLPSMVQDRFEVWTDPPSIRMVNDEQAHPAVHRINIVRSLSASFAKSHSVCRSGGERTLRPYRRARIAVDAGSTPIDRPKGIPTMGCP
eukprot:gene11759-biopygen9671